MGRFLFLSWDGAGNEPPAIGIAQELRNRRHQIIFAAQPRQRERFVEAGFGFSPLESSWGHWRETVHDPVFSATSHEGWTSPGHLEAVPEIFSREGCEALLIDCLMFAALTTAERLRLPAAILLHTVPGALVSPGGRFDRFLLGPVNKLRALRGLDPVDCIFDAWANLPALCTSIAELDPAVGRAPPSFVFIGPCFERAPASGWRAPWPSEDARPLILVSFSTGNAWNQSSRIKRTIAALADGPYRVLVTAGPANVSHLPRRENVALLAYLPHAEVLPQAALTVTHAGHGTVIASLAHGVPLLCLPNPAADQPALAAQLSALGVGLALDGETAKPPEIAEAVRSILADPSYRMAARRIAARMARQRGAEIAADRLEALASHGLAARGQANRAGIME